MTLPDDIDFLVQAVYENRVAVAEALRERLEKATMDGTGKALAEMWQANQAIIGFPDDASWNDPARFVLYDEDEPDVHRTLMGQTRLGEDSAVALTLWAHDEFRPEATQNSAREKRWSLRGECRSLT